MGAKTAVITVNFHNEKDTRECLNSLLTVSQHQDIGVYVVDPETEKTNLGRHPVKPKIIERGENGGFAWSNNLGIKAALEAGYEQLVLLNNDTKVTPNFLDALLTQLAQKNVGLVSPKIYFYPGREFHQDSYLAEERGKVIWYSGGVIDWQNMYAYHWGVDEVDHGQYQLAQETDYATGCCLAIAAKTVAKIGLLDERYFLYLEDVDWSLKAKRQGLKVMFEPQSVIWHKNAGSTRGSGSDLQRYYQTRNRLLFAWKYAPVRTKLAVGREAWRMLKQGSPAEKWAVKDAFLGQYGQKKAIR